MALFAEAEIRLPARALGELARQDACHACFWLLERIQRKLPYDRMPGVFNSIDSYTKKILRTWIASRRSAPDWLTVPDSTAYVERCLERELFSKLSRKDRLTNIRITGTPDEIVSLSDGTAAIIDYKTSKHTATQDLLFPLYGVQLNAYAWIAKDRPDIPPVSRLMLVYMKPETEFEPTELVQKCTKTGFILDFEAEIVPVGLDEQLFRRMLRQAKQILYEPTYPKGRDGCQDCDRLRQILVVIGN